MFAAVWIAFLFLSDLFHGGIVFVLKYVQTNSRER